MERGSNMVKCPDCKKELVKPKKTWTYGIFEVQAYSCNNCHTDFREYSQAGKHSFTLKPKKGKGFVKA
jgi:transposase-like protein